MIIEQFVSIDQEPDLSKLICPACRNTYLHQGSVRILNRFHEDGEGILTSVPEDPTNPGSRQLMADKGIRHGRRDYIEIDFECETCDASTEAYSLSLVISQHKGETFLRWERLYRPPLNTRRR